MRFAELSGYLPKVESTIARQYQAERSRRPPNLRPYVDALSEFTLRGGKRFRALLVLAGYHLASRRSPEPALSAAAAFEHFQTWMLVHDDIIDHSETRRGGPTLHRRVEAEFRTRSGIGKPEEYGAGMGITLGDLAEPFTVEALLASPGPPLRRLRAIEEYVRMTRETAYGQALDIRNGSLPIDQVHESDVLAVHRFKTAAYTVAAPLRIGAILGGGGPKLLDDLEAFGLDAGVAFQLRDDVLGTGFDAGLSGKSANDLSEGKRTLLVVRAWAGADDASKAKILKVLGRAESTAAELEAAREVIRSTGSLAYSERKIALLARRSDRRITGSRNLRSEGKALLGEIAERLVHRSA
ncbi:MAG: polyprenyl synthetase family protein [Thermoplasmata archaeon]|nr:polyprenyl synthetase family protein [Thermoplasmata archaeon]